MSTSAFIQLAAIVPSEYADKRLDQALALLFPAYSRAQLQRWVESGYVAVNGQSATSVRTKVKSGDSLKVRAPELEQTDWKPEALDLPILYEDESLIIINKPAGVVVHPAAGNQEGTLVNALLHHYPELSTIPRAGLVHRLDKDTTGLLVVARTLSSYHYLVKELQERRIKRDYFCIVVGQIISGGTVDAPLSRHPTQRTRRAVVMSGKPAVTHYRLLKRLEHFTGLSVSLETGRTHQIRVHMMHLGHPVLGDPVYGKRYLPRGITPVLKETLEAWQRQALHAQRLEFVHPVSQEIKVWTAPLPPDLENLWNILQEEDQ